MKLENESLPLFEPKLLRICELAFEGGIQRLGSLGQTFSSAEALIANLQDQAARNAFVEGVHEGYDDAQNSVGVLVIEWGRRIRKLEAQKKSSPKSEWEPIASEIEILRNRQLVLRRVIDSILLSIVGHELQILRRMSLDLKAHRIDPEVLQSTLKEANLRNQSNRYQFNVVSDLTTIVQVGDLVQIDLSPEKKPSWVTIELKSGRVNEQISRALSESSQPMDDSSLKELEAKLGAHAVSQAKRMERQLFRIEQVDNMKTKDSAVDPRIGKTVRTNPERVYTSHYHSEFRDLVETGAKSLTLRCIDACLHFACLPQAQLEQIGGFSGLVHLFYHLVRPGAPCAFMSQEGIADEVDGMKKLPPIFDLIHMNFADHFMLPLFMYPVDRSHQIDLAMGRTRVFAMMDFDEFIRIGNELGLQMRWATHKELGPLLNHAPIIPGSPNRRGIHVSLSNGESHVMMAGALFRVFSDLMTPKGLLTLAAQSFELLLDPEGQKPA